MTSKPDHPPADSASKQRYVPEGGDDQAIGTAFRRSLIGLLAIGVLVAIGIGVVAFSGERQEVVHEKHTDAPKQLIADEAILPNVPFVDVTQAAGVHFSHVNGAQGEKLLPETMGSGAAFFDADQDGDQDMLIVNGTSWPGATQGSGAASVLLLNDGSGVFTPSGWSLGPAMYGTGVACGDFNGDGAIDVYLAGLHAQRLLLNTGEGFRDVTEASGLTPVTETWGTSPAFADIDGDSDLDLFVPSYVHWSRDKDINLAFTLNGTDRAYGPPKQYAGAHSVLFRNNGDGTFADISKAAGIQVQNAATGVAVGKSLAVAPADLDHDGDIDFIVANDTTRNFLFRNRGDGTFDEVGEAAGLAYDARGMSTGAMGIDVGHYRNDASLAVGIGNFANEMTGFYVDGGQGQYFSDEAVVEGIGAPTRPQLSFGLLLLDYDLDGRLDLFQTNGHLEADIHDVQPSQSYRQPAQLFWNAGNGRDTCFEIVPPNLTGDLSKPIVGRGATYADIDGDGDLDLLITQPGEGPLLFRNMQDTGHHWLRVRLHDSMTANVHGLGAWIELTSAGVMQRRQVQPTRSYLSQVELPVTFGLGEADAISALQVQWPDGTRQAVDVSTQVPGVDRLITIERHSAMQ
jgi:hypothetical protein